MTRDMEEDYKLHTLFLTHRDLTLILGHQTFLGFFFFFGVVVFPTLFWQTASFLIKENLNCQSGSFEAQMFSCSVRQWIYLTEFKKKTKKKQTKFDVNIWKFILFFYFMFYV